MTISFNADAVFHFSVMIPSPRYSGKANPLWTELGQLGDGLKFCRDTDLPAPTCIRYLDSSFL